MQMPKDAACCGFLSERPTAYEGHPLYEAIVMKAREMQMAGATVLRGPMGYGRTSRLHTAKVLRLSEDLPIVIEIVDSQEKIDEFLPVLDGMIASGLVTLEKVQVLKYGDVPRYLAAEPLTSASRSFKTTSTLSRKSRIAAQFPNRRQVARGGSDINRAPISDILSSP